MRLGGLRTALIIGTAVAGMGPPARAPRAGGGARPAAPGAPGGNRLAGRAGDRPLSPSPTIAIVDSGVDGSRLADFGSRLVTQVNLSSREPSATGDQYGHGTMVAGIAAGASSSFPGAAPQSNIVSIRTADSNDESMVSDIVAAAQWVLDNKDAYGIRVVNLSLLS